MFVQHHNFGMFQMIRCGQARRTHNSPEHLHQYYELEMVFDGEIEITLNGSTVTARAGDMAIIPSFGLHAFHTPESTRMMICVFSPAFLSGTFSDALLLQPRSTHIFRPSKALWNYLIECGFSEMWGPYTFNSAEKANDFERMRSIFHMIMAEYFASVPPSKEVSYDGILPRVLAYMSAHFTEDLTLKSVGAALGYSPRYISNCLSVMPEISFRGLLNSMRTERAKELLRSTDDSNYEITITSGFNSECNFHKVFKALEGCTPGEYRARTRNV